MVTLRDVAAAAGVSAAAASYALRGDRRIGRVVAERVRAVAASLGYHRDPLQAALAGRRFRTRGGALQVAFLVNQVHQSSPDIARLAETLPARGYRLMPIAVDPSTDPGALSSRLHEGGVELLVCAARDPRLAAVAAGMRAAVFWQVESPLDPPGDVVLEAQWSACVWSALSRIRDAGWTRIGVVLPSPEPAHWQDDECRAAVAEAARCVPGITLVPGLFRPPSLLAEAILPWARRHRPEAMLCLTCMEPALLRAGGVDIPFAVLHSNRFSRDYRGMAGFCVDWGRMLAASVDLLDLRLRQRDHDGPRTILVQPVWTDGASLPSRR